MFDASDEVTFRLPAAEVDELIAAMQRSMKWSQQIISKLVIQAQQQAPANVVAPQPSPPNGSARRRSEPAA